MRRNAKPIRTALAYANAGGHALIVVNDEQRIHDLAVLLRVMAKEIELPMAPTPYFTRTFKVGRGRISVIPMKDDVRLCGITPGLVIFDEAVKGHELSDLLRAKLSIWNSL